MPKINYIRHLNTAFALFAKNPGLNPSHISLYLGLFQLWNINRFAETFFIHRDELMMLSKLGSKTTYHKCLNQLESFGYIQYFPSHNPFFGSKVSLTIFETSPEQALSHYPASFGTSSEQAVVPLLNNNKELKQNKYERPLHENEVIDFFIKENSGESEARIFYNHYAGLNWKMGKMPISDWRSVAKKWILRSEAGYHKTAGPHLGNLDVNKHKNYNAPL